LFEYGEFLLCIGPVFLIIALIFGGLLWNSLPRPKPKENPDDE
jgi:hypothetical protein